ncbi:uncharacterized protein PAC_08636 [Phialocephala subalpina]|uniref:Uncharacterized protein n=1 Tax=Phialocephala subalpina TaxID=576137 RepID=A0A1L7X147_9HELO|nr:uncharacterized protein PAC_08636 [Phialocephala subalpina]
MPSHRSDRRSSPGSSDASPRPESSVMCDVVKQEGGKEECAVVLVVDGINFYETQESCKSLVPKSRKVVKPKILVKVTTSNWLQATINEINGDQTRRYLTILVSQTIEEILFHVSATIGTLRILRCSDKQDTLGELLINGLSTFSSYKLEDWQGRKHKHQLYLGDRVMIKPDLFRSPSWATNKFSEPEVQEKDRIRSYFTSMDDIPMKDPTWWQSWKVVISSMLGLAASGAKILAGFEATAKGVYLQFQ